MKNVTCLTTLWYKGKFNSWLMSGVFSQGKSDMLQAITYIYSDITTKTIIITIAICLYCIVFNSIYL